jgi:membrane protein DedA with SNARE-associated domain
MDFLPDQESLKHWLLTYGSFSLFFLLALGIVALPIPDESIMMLAGVLMKKGDLHIVPTLLATYGGSMAGITLSYLIGRIAGSPIIHKYGAYIGMTEQKFQKVHDWFAHYGKWTLTFGYFVPGIRHFTGLAAGMSDLEYPTFALFAYMGAIIWTTVFLSIGFFLGEYWYTIVSLGEGIADQTVLILTILAVIAAIFIGIKVYKKGNGNKEP